MDKTYNEDKIEVVCCFCGKPLSYHDEKVINVKSNIKSEEVQQLFCHKEHFIEKLDKSVPLYIDN